MESYHMWPLCLAPFTFSGASMWYHALVLHSFLRPNHIPSCAQATFYPPYVDGALEQEQERWGGKKWSG